MIVHYRNPTLQIPSWNTLDDPPVNALADSPSYEAALAALHRYLPRNDQVNDDVENSDDEPLDSYSCDEFRMYEFKVRRCNRGRSHDWTECPYAHPGEKARRRDPRKYAYSGTACPEFRKGSCKRGDACEFSHGVFECWLHPSRYRTQPCKDGTACRRRVCFFAHTPEQLRVLSPSSPKLRVSVFDSYDGAPESPPVSPSVKGMQRASFNDIVSSLRQMQLSKVNSAPNSWKTGFQLGNGCFGSPRAAGYMSGLSSLPGTPTRANGGGGIWDVGFGDEDEVVERVESGRALRAKLVEKLSKDNAIEKPSCSSQAPDVAWVSELVNDEVYGGNIFSW